jgi:hypothetical protein
MVRPRIVDVDYQEFLGALRRASEAGQRIDAADKLRWAAWVKNNHMREAAFKSVGKSRIEGLQPVIIDDAGEWGGYYLYSKEEEACLKWVRGDENQ